MLTYAKAAVPLVPGASKLPWVAGGGGEIPADLAREREGVEIDRDHLAAYARVCGLRLRDEVPATYPHVLAFPLHMSLLTDGRFPFGAVGLVHIANRITVKKPIRVGDTLKISVRASQVSDHPKGKKFDLITEVRAGRTKVWESTSTTLRRGKGVKEKEPSPFFQPPDNDVAEWRLPGDLGRRYAKVSGDVNPIHMHALTAKAFGFDRAIAHGMWTKARCLSAIEASLPETYSIAVEFRKPILLPARVQFARDGDRFAVRSSKDTIHLVGEVQR